jgi:four helix bundle protein
MSSFHNLRVYNQSLQSIKLLYKFLQNNIIKNDYSLKDQIKRAAMSVTANIAEGYCRKTSKDRANFLTIAIGSANEVIAFLDIIKTVYNLEVKEYQDNYDHLGRQIYKLRKAISEAK